MRVSILILFSLLLLVFLHNPGYAEMVHYFDENGQIHYVNTAVTNVPEKYMNQVRPQLEKARQQEGESNVTEKKEEAQNSMDMGTELFEESDAAPEPPDRIVVDVLRKADCKSCLKLFSVLRQSKILFQSRNVDIDPRGKELYEKYPDMELPITVVGDQAVSGLDFFKIKQLVRELKNQQ